MPLYGHNTKNIIYQKTEKKLKIKKNGEKKLHLWKQYLVQTVGSVQGEQTKKSGSGPATAIARCDVMAQYWQDIDY